MPYRRRRWDDLFAEQDEALRHGISVERLDPSQITRLDPRYLRQDARRSIFRQRRSRQPATFGAGVRLGFPRLGRQAYTRTLPSQVSQLQNDKITSVETTAGSIATDMVIAAAGPQTALLAEMVGVQVPVAPARVEILATAPVPPLFDIALVGNGLYGRQAARGNLLFGGGAHEWTDVELTADPSKPNTPLIRNIARRLAELLPDVADVPVLRSWAGIVEQSPDYMPIIDIADISQKLHPSHCLSPRFRDRASHGQRWSAIWCCTANSNIDISGIRHWIDLPTSRPAGAKNEVGCRAQRNGFKCKVHCRPLVGVHYGVHSLNDSRIVALNLARLIDRVIATQINVASKRNRCHPMLDCLVLIGRC